MAALQGTILASKIVPTDSLDTYATHEDKYGRGGHRSVDTIVERDEITPERRKEGMTVYVKENKTKYILEGGIDNVNWKVDSSGGGSGGVADLSDYYKKTETYSKVEVDTKIDDIPPTDLSGYYNKIETETLLSNKVDKEVGKGLSTNDFTDAFKQALESNKVQNISTDSVTKKLVVTYTDGTFVDLNLDDVVTDVKVEGATLDATTNVLTILSSDGGADVTVDLSVFVTNQTLSNALVGKADKIHTHSTSDIDGLDITLSNKVTKNVAIVGDTKTKITYDSNGLVINGTDLSASDIPNLPQNKIINLETNLSNKQDTLVSGTSIKTINGQSVLGTGNIFITAESASPLLQPIITSPANGTVDYIGRITSTYSTSESFVGVQDWVRWEASTDENFTTLIDSYEGSDNLTSWTPSIGLALTQVFIRTKQGSDSHRSDYSDTLSFTTPNIFVQTPTLTVQGYPSEIGKNPTLTTSAFTVYNGTDEHLNTDYQILKNSDGSVVWESLGNTSNKLTINSGDLVKSTEYRFRARHNSKNYGSSTWVEVIGTTKSQFVPSGIAGTKGFSVAPTNGPFAVLGLAKMTGTDQEGHDNYGNYIHTNGSVVCWLPKMYYRVGDSSSPRFATYGENALDMVGTNEFATEAEANASGYALHRCFINGGKEQPGFFVDKYMNSKDGSGKSKSVFAGVPISLYAASSGLTTSDGMTGCTGILADAVVLSKTRGSRWNCTSAFIHGYLALVSVAQAQAATSTADVAWYDPTGVKNYPKGCNNNALSDVDDTSVVYASAGDTSVSSKPKTGATANFAKTTHNGSNNGVADLNGGMFEVTIGVTNIGSSATATTTIANDTIYVLKHSTDIATLTGGWNGATDAWGDAANLATKYDSVTSPHPLGSSTGAVYWGNGTNAVLQNDLSGVNRDVCGFIPKNSNSTGATGANLFGNDQLNKNNIQNMIPLACGFSGGAKTGVFHRTFTSYRSNRGYDFGFRASAYFA